MAIGTLDTPVETADSTDNTLAFEVVGNKTDAANETAGQSSIVGLLRAVIVRLVALAASAGAGLGAAVTAIAARLADPPGVDDAADVTPSDRIGMKADTVGGTSLISLARQALAALGVIDAFHDVPAPDAAANAQLRDVVGNKTDTVGGDSLYSQHLIGQAALAAGLAGTTLAAARDALLARANGGEVATWPNLAAGVTVAGGAGAYAYGAAPTQITAAGPAGGAFVVEQVLLNGPSGAQIGQLEINTGAALAEVPICEIPYELGAAGFATITLPRSGAIVAGERLSCRLATQAGGAQTVDVKLVTSILG